jgi:CDGSH-type Zn-finger protein
MYSKGEPFITEVSEGDTVYICQCGQTKTPPYCDGSHENTDKQPLIYTSKSNQQLFICGCGKSAAIPFCDGSHAT